MKILVCIKQVPDTTEVKIDPVTNNLVREGVPSITNPYDAATFTMALSLREQTGGTVSVLSMGPPQAAKELERALAKGADEAYLLCDRRFGGADTLATGYALAETAKKIGFDIILCGNEAIDGCTGQVGPLMGENLQIPAVTYVSDVKPEKGKLILTRDTGKSLDIYEAMMPLVVCIANKETVTEEKSESVTEKTVQILDASHLDENRIGSKGSPTKVASISVKERMQNYLFVDYRWSCEERIEYILNGGLEKKEVVLNRECKEKQKQIIMNAVAGK